jgi:hypothetical protein
VSSPKSKAKLSVNEQVKARLSALKDFLSGRSTEAKAVNTADSEVREVVGAELLAAMSATAAGTVEDEDTQPLHAATASSKEQERARQLFLEHGYFEEAIESLRGASSNEERAAAARALGLVENQRATPHLIAAMFDEDIQVRSAAEEALNRIGARLALPALPHIENAAAAKTSETSSSVEAVADSSGNTLQIMEAQTESSIETPHASMQLEAEAPNELTSIAPNTTEADDLLQQEQVLRQSVAEIDQRLHEVAASLTESENQLRWRIEREVKLRTDAEKARLEEERLRVEAEAAAEDRRRQVRNAVRAEQAARQESEAEIQRRAEQENSLRLKASNLRASVLEIVRQQAERQNARAEAAEAALRAEAARVRDDAQRRHEAELELLRREQEALTQATQEVATQQANVVRARENATNEIARLKEEVAAAEAAQRDEAARLRREAEARNVEAQEHLRQELERLREAGDVIARRRREVEAAREKADADAETLLQAQARMQAAEQARAQAELERSQLEAKIHHQVETQQRMLQEARQHEQDEKQRLEEQLRFHAEKEQQHLAEIEAMKIQAESESKQRLEREQQIRGQIDSLRIADAETRRRIADAEVKRRAAEDAYRLIAEKVQRVEQEAHARAKEEEQILAKLEAERRTVAIEAQSRAEQEKRIREEIEMFRRLEEEDRPRIEAATLRLAAAEARMEELKQGQRRESEIGFQLTESAIIRDYDNSSDYEPPSGAPFHDNIRPFVAPQAAAKPIPQPDEADSAASDDSSRFEFSTLTPAIASYLNSVDPYKRAAAVGELARLGSPDAFSRIAECFDDHSLHVRNAAARALRTLEPVRTVDLFNRALEEATEERRKNIGAAIAASGLADEAINNLGSDKREETYNALSILFVMAKTGEVTPLVRALEQHPNDDIGRAVSKLLTLSGHRDQES